jgi:hypothetical protein
MGVKESLYDLVAFDDPAYAMLAEIREAHHQDTLPAKIALAWKKGIKADADGHVILGLCVRASELQRELVDYDFCIVLNREVWTDDGFTDAQKRALIDHEMCHVAHSVDEEGEWRVDSKNRFVWRLRGHDIEEFTAIIARHGCYKRDLENFAQKILEQKNWLALADQPQPKIIHGETILIPANASMGTEMIDPFPDGKVY